MDKSQGKEESVAADREEEVVTDIEDIVRENLWEPLRQTYRAAVLNGDILGDVGDGASTSETVAESCVMPMETTPEGAMESNDCENPGSHVVDGNAAPVDVMVHHSELSPVTSTQNVPANTPPLVDDPAECEGICSDATCMHCTDTPLNGDLEI